MAYALGTVISVLRFSGKLNKAHFHATPKNQKEGIYTLKLDSSFRLSQVGNAALVNATIPGTIYGAPSCLISATFPDLPLDCSRFSCCTVVCVLMPFYSLQASTSDIRPSEGEQVGSLGCIYPFTFTTGSPLAGDSTSGISRLLCSLALS